jgi:predicted RNA-binding protein with PIN domain
MTGSPTVVIVDGNNVIGTVPDGWWRDRPAAVRRLLRRMQRLAAQSGDELVLVLDVAAPDLPEGDHTGVEVVYARRSGRDAADDRIRELVAERHAEPLEVVTSDRALAEDVRAVAQVVPATRFLDRLAATER